MEIIQTLQTPEMDAIMQPSMRLKIQIMPTMDSLQTVPLAILPIQDGDLLPLITIIITL